MTSPDTELLRRQVISRRVANAFNTHTKVAATLVFGSVALGRVDMYSDIDLLIVCAELPSLVERKQLAVSLGLTFANVGSDTPLFCDQDSCVGEEGLELSLHYQRAEWLETTLAEVLDGAITTAQLPFRPYTLLGLLHHGWLLTDRCGVVTAWRKRLYPYPQRLKRNIILSFAPILRESAEELLVTAQRDLGPRNIIFHLNWGVDALAGILLALNEQYDSAERRFEQAVLPRLRTKPEQFDARLQAILVGPFDKKGSLYRAQIFKKLADETLELAQAWL